MLIYSSKTHNILDQNWYMACRNKGLYADNKRPGKCFMPLTLLPSSDFACSGEVPPRHPDGHSRATVEILHVCTSIRR